jgi:hypothetical protein
MSDDFSSVMSSGSDDPFASVMSAPAAAVSALTTGDPAKQAAAAQPDAPFVARLGAALNGVPRQIGLTARDALEGAGQTAQIISEPIRYATDRLLGTTGKTLPAGALASNLADALGLPTPQNETERVVNEGAKLGFGAMGGAGGAKILSNIAAPAATSRVGQMLDLLTANPAQQVTSAAGAGAAGQASKEAGGSPLMQTAASVAGGVAGGLAPGMASGAWNGVIGAGKKLLTPGATTADVDTAFQTAMQSNGINLGAMAPAARMQLRSDFAQAMNTGGVIDEQGLRNLAAIRAVGGTPTLGMVTQDPVQVTREMNLAKLGANSNSTSLQGLPRIQAANNDALIGQLNQLGGSSGALPITAGRQVLGGVVTKANALQQAEQAAWDAAKSHPGWQQPISTAPLNAAFGALDDQAQLGFLPKQITDYMGAFQSGAQDFTPQHYRNLRSLLSGAQAEGGNTAAAATTAARALDSVPIAPKFPVGGNLDFGGLPATSDMAAAMRAADSQSADAVDLVNQARAATKAKYAYQESSPLVKTALSDARSSDPEKLAQSFVLNGTVNDAQHVLDAVGPQGADDIRDALGAYIKKQALNGADDDLGKVSPARLKQTLDSIGDEKLGMFYTPEEVAQLRNVSRAASLMDNRPKGSAVNESNSGAMVVGKALDFLDSKVLRFLPGADYTPGLITAPLRNINASVAQRGVQNVVPGLLQPQTAAPRPSLALPLAGSTALFTSGLLGSP